MRRAWASLKPGSPVIAMREEEASRQRTLSTLVSAPRYGSSACSAPSPGGASATLNDGAAPRSATFPAGFAGLRPAGPFEPRQTLTGEPGDVIGRQRAAIGRDHRGLTRTYPKPERSSRNGVGHVLQRADGGNPQVAPQLAGQLPMVHRRMVGDVRAAADATRDLCSVSACPTRARWSDPRRASGSIGGIFAARCRTLTCCSEKRWLLWLWQGGGSAAASRGAGLCPSVP